MLQRIGVCYTIAALTSLRTTLKQQVAIVASLLLGYWFVMTLVPVPGAMGGIGANLNTIPSRTLAAWTDRFLLGGHLWINSVTWDPEGPLSTIPAIGTAMLGIFAGRWLGEKRPLDERLNALFAVGALGMMVGLMWNWSFPINKNIWTSSYVVFTAGVACVTLATIVWIVDVRRVRAWTTPLVIYGMNPLVAFVGSEVMARYIYSIWFVQYLDARVPVETAIYKTAFASWLEPRDASFAFAFAFVLFWYAVLYVMYRRRIFVKV